MKRTLEFLIVSSTLVAIASTFFLYRSYNISPRLTTSVIKSSEPLPLPQETVTESTKTPPPAPDFTPTTTADILVDSTQSPITISFDEEIHIERIPLDTSDLKKISEGIHNLTNLSRSQNNLSGLKLDQKLTALATARSKDMIIRDYFSHTTPDGCDLTCRFKDSGISTLSWGENLAESKNYSLVSPKQTADTFMSNWLASSRHRDNILSKNFTHYGIGIDASQERVVVTVIFAKF